MNDEIINIVDKDDNIVGTKRRDEITENDIIRVSSLWVEDSNGNVLLQQRAFKKSRGGGQWQSAVAGTVESHETYLENIIKESEEEIGLTDFTPLEVGKILVQEPDGKFGRIVTFYKTVCAKPIEDFTLEVGEAEQLKWMNKDELLIDLDLHPQKYVRSAVYWKELFY
jgi:8-oxo-dGTP pyrophosphatase MutT (NUDIX family)